MPREDIETNEWLTYDIFSGYMQDRPIYSPDGRIIFVSTHQPSKIPRQGWTAIYSISGDAGQLSSKLMPATNYFAFKTLCIEKCLIA